MLFQFMKKDDKQKAKNYRHILLLAICSKIFERLIYKVMFDFLTENDLLSPNQPGFRSGDFDRVTLDRVNGFDKGYKVCGIFLDILKADKVWHDGLIFKLR